MADQLQGLRSETFYRTNNICWTVLRTWIRIISGKLDPYLDPHQSEKQDPDLQQSEKVEAFEVHFGLMQGPNLEKSEW